MAKASAQTTTRTTSFTPRRGRPSAAQLAAISETILTAAQALFLTEGYAHTTMEAVAASAGVGKATLYARYPTKHDLFQAIFAARIDAWKAAGAEVGAPDDNEPDVGAWLRQRAISMLRALRDPEVRAFDHLMVSEASRFPELARAFHEMGHMLNVRLIAERLAQANGEAAPSEQTLLVADLFASSLIGWFRQQSALGEVGDAACEAAATTMARLLIDGRAAWRPT